MSGETRTAAAEPVAPHRRSGSFFASLRAVAWSFFGVRRAVDYEDDVARLNPLHLVAAAIVAALLFIALLVALVHWVSSSGVAG